MSFGDGVRRALWVRDRVVGGLALRWGSRPLGYVGKRSGLFLDSGGGKAGGVEGWVSCDVMHT
jgi:hypothetical protein